MEKLKWNEYVTLAISAISITVAGGSAYYQFQQSERYSDSTHQILVNSAKLATYDVNLMTCKVSRSTVRELDYGQLNIQLDSLNQNLETIKSIDPTTLPKDDAINYQAYRQDLNTIITIMKSYAADMRKDKSLPVDDSEKLVLNMGTRENFAYGATIARSVLKRDSKALKDDKNLYKVAYEPAIQEMENK